MQKCLNIRLSFFGELLSFQGSANSVTAGFDSVASVFPINYSNLLLLVQ
jgi:hypothetical protein